MQRHPSRVPFSLLKVGDQMYRISCDGYPILDLRDDDFFVLNPELNLEVNTVHGGSFTIYKQHPFFDKLKRLKSIFEISDDIGVIFRGRMTDDSLDFDNGKKVDMEGALAFFNDSVIRPYDFPNDFLDDSEYIKAEESGNVVEFFLKWLIEQHNEQVKDFQRFKLGKVTVSDVNNYITRENSNYPHTWDVLKEKLFDSALGGYLCIRYEADGNYVDYLSEFELMNPQTIDFGENLLDIQNETDATATFSAILPIGAEIEREDGTKYRITLSSLPDGDITEDIVKKGDLIYSRSAVEMYGWICAPVNESTWDDITEAANLQTKAAAALRSGMMLANTVTFTAADLHYSDSEIQSFRMYRNIKATSAPHGISDIYPLTKLEIKLLDTQSTKITVGQTKLTLTEANQKQQSESIERIQTAEKDVAENRAEVVEVRNQIVTESTNVLNTCTEIIMTSLSQYVETSNLDEFRQSVEAQLKILADEIAMTFTTATEHIESVDGDMQTRFEELQKYISFSENGIKIGDNTSGITLEIDNDKIAFKRNGEQFGWWDGTDFHTGNIVVGVDERAQFGDFAFKPRPDNSLAFLKVGG